jgi:putative restriction endonuclease
MTALPIMIIRHASIHSHVAPRLDVPGFWAQMERSTCQMEQLPIANGIALSKIHHAAFDNHLIGIDPDGRVHVSERLLMLHDGPLLEQSLKAVAGAFIRLPRSKQYHPDRDRLAIRFEQFKRAA